MKRNVLQHKIDIKKLKPCLVRFYDIRPGNRAVYSLVKDKISKKKGAHVVIDGRTTPQNIITPIYRIGRDKESNIFRTVIVTTVSSSGYQVINTKYGSVPVRNLSCELQTRLFTCSLPSLRHRHLRPVFLAIAAKRIEISS